MMFSVGIRDHVMIAHSLRAEVFGPAQRLHGATYVVDVELRAGALDRDGVVVDIGRATKALRAVLDKLSYRNLDEMPELAARNTTTERVAEFVLEQLSAQAASGALGSAGADLASIKVTLHESHVAWASFEKELPRRA